MIAGLIYFGYHPFKGDQNCYDEREKLRQWIDHNFTRSHSFYSNHQGEENSDSSFPEDYTVKNIGFTDCSESVGQDCV